jgi:hypothetical protein
MRDAQWRIAGHNIDPEMKWVKSATYEPFRIHDSDSVTRQAY